MSLIDRPSRRPLLVSIRTRSKKLLSFRLAQRLIEPRTIRDTPRSDVPDRIKNEIRPAELKEGAMAMLVIGSPFEKGPGRIFGHERPEGLVRRTPVMNALIRSRSCGKRLWSRAPSIVSTAVRSARALIALCASIMRRCTLSPPSRRADVSAEMSETAISSHSTLGIADTSTRRRPSSSRSPSASAALSGASIALSSDPMSAISEEAPGTIMRCGDTARAPLTVKSYCGLSRPAARRSLCSECVTSPGCSACAAAS